MFRPLPGQDRIGDPVGGIEELHQHLVADVRENRQATHTVEKSPRGEVPDPQDRIGPLHGPGPGVPGFGPYVHVQEPGVLRGMLRLQSRPAVIAVPSVRLRRGKHHDIERALLVRRLVLLLKYPKLTGLASVVCDEDAVEHDVVAVGRSPRKNRLVNHPVRGQVQVRQYLVTQGRKDSLRERRKENPRRCAPGEVKVSGRWGRGRQHRLDCVQVEAIRIAESRRDIPALTIFVPGVDHHKPLGRGQGWVVIEKVDRFLKMRSDRGRCAAGIEIPGWGRVPGARIPTCHDRRNIEL